MIWGNGVSKWSLQSGDCSGVSFTIHLRAALTELMLLFFSSVLPVFSLLFCFYQIVISALPCLSHLKFPFVSFFNFLRCSFFRLPFLVLGFVFSLLFVYTFPFFPFLLLMHF